MTDFAVLGKAVYCAAGHAVARVDYSRPGRPQRVHADGTLCDHGGPVRIGDKQAKARGANQ